MKMEINGVQTELSVEEFVKLSEILEGKSEEEAKEVSGYEIARSLIDELLVEEEEEEEEGADLPERFSVGDVVMLNDCARDVGVIVEDDEEDSFPYKVEYPSGVTEWCDPTELHRLEGEELAEYNRDHIEEGAIVVIIGNTNFSANNVGDVGKVGELSGAETAREVLVPNGSTGGIWTYLKEMRLATEDERKQYEEAVAELDEESTEELPFKVGDKVRVIVPSTEDPQFGWSVVKSGDVGEVNKVSPDKISVTFESHEDWSAHPSELELFDENADLPAGTTIKSRLTGKVYTVENRKPSKDEEGFGKAYTTTPGTWSGIKQVEVLNVPLAEPTPTDTEHTIEVGDIVQVTEDSWGHLVGTIGVVGSVNKSDEVTVLAVRPDDGEFAVYSEGNVKLIAKNKDRKDV